MALSFSHWGSLKIAKHKTHLNMSQSWAVNTLPWACRRGFGRAWGGGLLTALNKSAPASYQVPDARPVKAENSDTSMRCMARARFEEAYKRDEAIPKQLGVGVAGGQELYVHGFNLKIEKAASVIWFRVSSFRRLQIPAMFLTLKIYRNSITLIVVRFVAEMSRGPNAHAFFCMALAALLMH